jgi:hypothetical protein
MANPEHLKILKVSRPGTAGGKNFSATDGGQGAPAVGGDRTSALPNLKGLTSKESICAQWI